MPSGAYLEMPVGVPPVVRRMRVSPIHLYMVLHWQDWQLPTGEGTCDISREGDDIVFRPPGSREEPGRIARDEFERALASVFGIHSA